MTHEEILEYNKRCAEFLTINEELKNELSAYPLQEYSYLCSYANSAFICDREDNPSNTVWDYCKFHSDWNWIMEVVEAIEKLGHIVDIWNNVCVIPHLKKCISETKKEAVVQAINQFLIWYNKHI